MNVAHWFDFICPYCYVAQDRNRILRDAGIHLVEHGLQIHPEIGPGGLFVGPRVGPSYDFLAEQAADAGLPLHWSNRIAYSKPALAAFEWLQQRDAEAAERFAATVFYAYFAEGRDIGATDVLRTLLAEADADLDAFDRAGNTPDQLLGASQARAARYGVQGTPTWIVHGQAVSGLRPRAWFARWAHEIASDDRWHNGPATDSQ